MLIKRRLSTPDSSDSSGAREIASFAARKARGAEANANALVYFKTCLKYYIAYRQWSFQTLILMLDLPRCWRRSRPDLLRVVVRTVVNSDAHNDPPISSACSPVIARPVKMRSFAFDSPSKRTRRCVPPAPGMIPNLVSGKPIFVAPDPAFVRQLQMVMRQCNSRADLQREGRKQGRAPNRLLEQDHR